MVQMENDVHFFQENEYEMNSKGDHHLIVVSHAHRSKYIVFLEIFYISSIFRCLPNQDAF